VIIDRRSLPGERRRRTATAGAIRIEAPAPACSPSESEQSSSFGRRKIHLARRLLSDHALRRGLGLEVLVEAEAADVRVGADALDAGEVAARRVGLRGNADAAARGGAVGHRDA